MVEHGFVEDEHGTTGLSSVAAARPTLSTADVAALPVEPALHDTVTDLLGLVQRTTTAGMDAEKSAETPGPSATALQTYAAEKYVERMEQITDPDADIPEVSVVVEIDACRSRKKQGPPPSIGGYDLRTITQLGFQGT